MNVVLTNTLSLLATLFAADPAPVADPASPAAPAGSGPFSAVMMIFVFLIAIFFLFILPAKSRDKQAKKLYDSLKVNDKVLTTGGIIGTITSIDREAQEVVLRVDDSVKIHFAISAIYFVFNKEAALENKAKEKKDKK